MYFEINFYIKIPYIYIGIDPTRISDYRYTAPASLISRSWLLLGILRRIVIYTDYFILDFIICRSYQVSAMDEQPLTMFHRLCVSLVGMCIGISSRCNKCGLSIKYLTLIHI